MVIKTASALKYEYENSQNPAKFFTRENMRFGGDMMANYGVRYDTKEGASVIVLYRRHITSKGFSHSVCFCANSFKYMGNF
jgi:hypothetical protein